MDGACRARERAPRRYQPRRPSQSALYRCVQEHLEPGQERPGEVAPRDGVARHQDRIGDLLYQGWDRPGTRLAVTDNECYVIYSL